MDVGQGPVNVMVLLLVPMRVDNIGGTVMVSVLAVVIVGMVQRGVLASYAELRRRDARADHALGPDGRRRDGEAAKRATDVFELDPGVDQGAKHHVARGTGEAIEVQNLHNPFILSVVLPSSQGSLPRHVSRLQHREVHLIGQDEMVHDVDPHDVAGADHA